MISEDSEKSQFKLAEQVYNLAHRLIERAEGIDIEYEAGRIESLFEEGGAYILIAKTFLYSATDDFRAAFLLLEEQLYNLAFTALRRLFEFAVDLQFIGKRPEIYTKQYLLFEKIQIGKFVEYIKQYWSDKIIDKERIEFIFKDAEEAKVSLGYNSKKKPLKQWSSYDYATKCREIGWEKQYDLVYRLCCTYAHPSPHGLGSFLESLPGG